MKGVGWKARPEVQFVAVVTRSVMTTLGWSAIARFTKAVRSRIMLK